MQAEDAGTQGTDFLRVLVDFREQVDDLIEEQLLLLQGVVEEDGSKLVLAVEDLHLDLLLGKSQLVQLPLELEVLLFQEIRNTCYRHLVEVAVVQRENRGVVLLQWLLLIERRHLHILYVP